MSLSYRVCITLGVWGLLVFLPVRVSAQSGYVTNGIEYAPAGNLPGDQIHPAAAVSPNGGILAWDDNITDTDGQGISVQLLDGTFSPIFGTIHLNRLTAGDQERPAAAVLSNGGKVVVWQGGPQSFQHIYGAFLSSNNVVLNTNGDVMINTDTNHYQVGAAMAALAGGNAVVTWSSFGQDNADGFQGVYAQIMSPSGSKIGPEIPVNVFTPYNQRTPAVAAFPNGNFIIAWVSEQERSSLVSSGGSVISGHNSVDIYARLFDSNGTPQSGEFLVNTDTNLCANPAVAVATDNSFTVVWSEKNLSIPNNGWDIYSRQFTSPTNAGAVQVVNSQLYGDQYGPRIAALGTDYMVTWTSLGQDGSREGVYAQFLRNGAHMGPEFRVNTTTLNSQVYPTVASDGSAQFLAVWSSFVSLADGMDLMAQRYISTNEVLLPPAPPVVSALAPNVLSVAWAPLAGFNLDHWNLYVDGSATPDMTTNIYWQNEGINDSGNDYNPGSAHTFQLAYVLGDGRQSPLSATASGTTFQLYKHGFDLPWDWETLYYGTNWSNWKESTYQLAPGVTVGMVFLMGSNPNNPGTWLVQSFTRGSEGMFLNWNTVAGAVYQVQSSPDTRNWSDLGAPRFAIAGSDSIFLGTQGGAGQSVFYRITRLTY